MNRFILSLAALLVLTGAVVGYFFAVEKRLPTSWQDLGNTLFSSAITMPQELEITKELSSKIPQVENVDLSSTNATEQFKTLTSRAGEISQHTQNVLGKSIQKNEEEVTPLHESALEYGKYIYCKQVVDSYEAAAQTEPTPKSEENN